MPRHARLRLRFTPEWGGALERYTCKFIKKNQWRCDSVHEFRDLMQDAYLVFLKISDKYPRVVEGAHFMSLYKRALFNQMHDHARYMRRKRENHVETAQDVSDIYTGHIGEATNAGHLNALLTTAPEELQEALAIITQNPQALRGRKGYQRENLNMKLRRLTELDKCALNEHKNYDFTGKLQELLT